MRIIWSLLILWNNESQTSLKEAQHQYRRTRRWCHVGAYNWIFSGRSDAKTKVPILWPPDAKSWLIAKDPDSGKDWRKEEKGMREDEIVEWHHWLDGHIWADSGSWWWTGKSGVLQSMGLQRVGHDWATELTWTDPNPKAEFLFCYANPLDEDIQHKNIKFLIFSGAT